ncbi:hypothetical protein PROP_02486 [Propionicimonas sp. T2.31MG-18]|uniref:hypothetical protein n=1 Tax=Propionicimonas sp. T2.31MG-18 TaxID=3157620 RepID=UPI0035E5DF43
MPPRNWPRFAGLAALWGASMVALWIAVGGLGWALAAVLQCLVVAATVALASRGAGARVRLGGPAVPVLVTALALAVQSAGLAVALGRLGVAPAVLVLSAMPLFAALTGQVWGIDRITGVTAAGLGVGFLGLLFVVAFPADGDSWAFITGVLCGLASALAAAFVSRYGPRRLGADPGRAVTANLLAAAVLSPWLVVAGIGMPGLGEVAALGLIALAAVGIAPILIVPPRDAAAARFTSGVKLTGMVLALGVGLVALGDRLTALQVVGAVLVLCGTLLVSALLPPRLLRRWRSSGVPRA